MIRERKKNDESEELVQGQERRNQVEMEEKQC